MPLSVGNCFNEAVAFQPRKLCYWNCNRDHLGRFNEAVAFQPRKSPTSIEDITGRDSFNEAVAFQPRKFSTQDGLTFYAW